MAGVALGGERGLPQARGHPARERGPVYRAPRAPGVEGVARLHRAGRAGDDIGRAEMIVQHVEGLRGGGRGGRLQHHRRPADIGLVRDRRAALDHLVAAARDVIGGAVPVSFRSTRLKRPGPAHR